MEHHLQMWRAWQQAQGLSERTISERAATIRSLINYTGEPPRGLTPNGIMLYIGRDGLSQNARSTYHATIRAYCDWLIRAGLRQDDPTKHTPSPKRSKGLPRPVSDDQLAAMLARVNRRRTRIMVLLAALAGLRIHEIAKVHGRDVDFLDRTITVVGKGNKLRVIPMHADLERAARSFPRDGYWLPAYDGRDHITRQGVYYAIRGVMRRAGIPGTPHALRHWYATSLLDGGVDVRVVQELMGHESLTSTQIYTRVSDRQRRAGIDVLHLPERSERLAA